MVTKMMAFRVNSFLKKNIAGALPFIKEGEKITT
jgi:hypothetical protein